MEKVAPIDSAALTSAARYGRFMELLATLPRERWAERTESGNTLLHFACYGPNVAAVVELLQSGLLDVNVRNKWGHMPANTAAWSRQSRVLEMLCATGANLRASDCQGLGPIDSAIRTDSKASRQTVRVLVANGVRLSTVTREFRRYITPELVAFERGVLRCRAAAVSMMRVKKAGKLWQWDKFLLREMAYALWATRYEEEWQN